MKDNETQTSTENKHTLHPHNAQFNGRFDAFSNTIRSSHSVNFIISHYFHVYRYHRSEIKLMISSSVWGTLKLIII